MNMSKVDRKVLRVYRAAMRLCAAGRGFCFRDDLTVSHVGIARQLEKACAAAKKGKRK